MSKRYIEFQFENGEKILVEADVTDDDFERVSGSLVERAKKSFTKTLSVLGPFTKEVHEQISSMVSPPDEATIEFGIKLSVKGDLIVTSGSGETSCKIVLCWKTA